MPPDWGVNGSLCKSPGADRRRALYTCWVWGLWRSWDTGKGWLIILITVNPNVEEKQINKRLTDIIHISSPMCLNTTFWLFLSVFIVYIHVTSVCSGLGWGCTGHTILWGQSQDAEVGFTNRPKALSPGSPDSEKPKIKADFTDDFYCTYFLLVYCILCLTRKIPKPSSL